MTVSATCKSHWIPPALKTLDSEPIHAHTPPAKGRVERAHKTWQDRLVKELRLRSLRAIEPANALLPPPAVILGTPVVPAEGGTTGVSGIQRNKGNHLGISTKHQPGSVDCVSCFR